EVLSLVQPQDLARSLADIGSVGEGTQGLSRGAGREFLGPIGLLRQRRDQDREVFRPLLQPLERFLLGPEHLPMTDQEPEIFGQAFRAMSGQSGNQALMGLEILGLALQSLPIVLLGALPVSPISQEIGIVAVVERAQSDVQ